MKKAMILIAAMVLSVDISAQITGTDSSCPCIYPSIVFKESSRALSPENKTMLSSVANKLKEHPACTVIVIAYPAASKTAQSLCEKRINAVKTYLFETAGVSEDRIALSCEIGGGDKDTCDIKCN